MGTIGQDIRYAFRTLWHAPAFTLVVVLTLGLGIGANTAIFTLTDQVLLRALPVHDPAALVTLNFKGADMGRREGPRTFSYPMFRGLRAGNDVFSGMLARYRTSLTMLVDNRAERVRGELVSGDYFQVLGLQAAHGRLLGPGDEMTPGGHPVAVLSHGFWSSRFGGDRSIVGRQVRLNGHPMTVVGVAPARFHGVEVGDSPDLFVPLMMKAQMTPTYDGLQDARSMWLNAMGRLKPGVRREQAQAGMTVRFRQLRRQELKEMAATPPSFQKRFVESQLLLEPGYKGLSQLREQFSTPMIVLMSMVGLVLLIACANVANLLMARAPARQREIAIRLALGASRGRIVRQLLVESLMLSLLGGAAGLLVAAWTADLLLRALPFERAVATLSSTPDARVLLFALAVSVITGVLFGLVPAWQTARPQLVTALKEESGSVSVGGHVRLRKGLVVAQVALSLLLLVGAGLFARSLWNLRSLDPGFRTEALTTFSVDPALSGYTAERSVSFYERLQERLRAIPGVTSVSVAAITPLTDSLWMSTVNVEGYRRKEGEDVNPQVNSVGPDYFRTLGISLVAGRDFSVADGPKAPKVAIVNEKMAQYFWGTESPNRPPVRVRPRRARHRSRRRRPRRQAGILEGRGGTPRVPAVSAGRRARRPDGFRAISGQRGFRRGPPAGRAPNRRGRSRVRRSHHGTGRRRVAVLRPDGGDVVGGLRRARHAAGGGRPLRRHELRGGAPAAGNRPAHGARRRARLGHLVRDEGSVGADRHRHRGRRARLDRREPPRAVAVVRRRGRRPRHGRRGFAPLVDGCAARRLPAGGTGDAHRIRCGPCVPSSAGLQPCGESGSAGL